MIMPFGTYTTPKRFTGLAEVLARAESAGTMLSRSGSASVAPMPRRTVRRGMAFLAMNIRHSLTLDLPDAPAFARACCPTRAMAGKPDLPDLPAFARACCPTRAMAGKPDLPDPRSLRSRVLSDARYGGQARPTRTTPPHLPDPPDFARACCPTARKSGVEVKRGSAS